MQSPVSFIRLLGLGAVLVVVPISVHGQDDSDKDWNHFGLNLRAGFNIGAKFSEPAVNGGFVKPDSTGSEDGQTWYWSYKGLSEQVGPNLDIKNTTAGNENTTQNANLGYDFNYIRDIGHESWGQWGIKFGFGYTPIDVRDSGAISTISTSTDYSLDGITLPNKPYVGTSAGPGPIISSVPDGGPTTMSASILGSHNIDASLFDLRLGPSVNIPLGKGFSVQGSGGLAVGVVDSHFTFNDSALGVSGSGSETGVLPGGYAELGFAYRVSRTASIYTGAQFEYLGDFRQSANGRSAELQLGATIFYELGLQFHF